MCNKIFIDCERLKYEHTGLYHFCLHLGKALSNKMNSSKELFSFFVPPSYKGIFGNNVSYVKQYSFHKFWLPSKKTFQVWHATHQGTNYYPYRGKIKRVFTIHDINFMYDERKSSKEKNKYLKELQKRIDQSDHITTISKFVLQDIEKYINLENKKATVIYSGCNMTLIKKMEQPIIQPSKPFLFTIGTIMSKKNFHVLPALLKNNNKELVIAGIVQHKDYKEKIIKEADKHCVRDRIIFTGSISENDKQWYYQNCEAFVFPSIAEGFGFPIIEAMYFGKPVFLSKGTSLPEIGGEVAYYFDNFDPEHMQEVLEKGLIHYQETQAEAKIKQRASLFTWEKAAVEYINVYRSLYN